MGILYIIATPLGNLGDLTFRAAETLKSVDLVVCEDTRQTVKLLNHYGISKPLLSYFQHSKLGKVEQIFESLNQGKNVALVTDAGTPGISDPGGKLIEQLLSLAASGFLASGHPRRSSASLRRPSFNIRSQPTGDADLKIVPIPGPCAAVAALSISGFPTDKFVFMGFPPHKKGRETYFKQMAAAEQTIVFYESTHRILKALEQIKVLMPDKKLVVCRELTKMFESVYRGGAEEILNILNSDANNQKGEFVVVLK